MSNDQSINTALWNFCMQANDGPHRGAGPNGEANEEAVAPLPPRNPEDLAWLRKVMESMEMPDKTMMRLLKQLYRLDADSTKKVVLGEKKYASPAAKAAAEKAAAKAKEALKKAAAEAGAGKKDTDSSGAEAEEEEKLSNEEIVEMLMNGVLEEMSDAVEDLNFATEFQLMKGPEVVLYKLDGPSARSNAELRTMLFLIIAHSCQNLPDLQESFSKLEWARQLVPLLKEETNAAASAANIMACSSMCRGSAKASGEFVNAGGFDALFSVLTQNVSLIEDGKKEQVDVKSCLRGIRLLHYFLLGKVSSTQVLEKVAMLTLPLATIAPAQVEEVNAETTTTAGGEELVLETLAQVHLRETATEYLLTFFKVLGGNDEMQLVAKAMCQQKLLPSLLAMGESQWTDEQKELLALIK